MPTDTPQKVTIISWPKVILTVLIIVVVTGAISGSLFWYFCVRQPAETTSVTTTKQSTTSAKKATSSVQKSKTVGWNIYTNIKLGFSIEYPTDLTLGETNRGASFNNYKKFGITDPTKTSALLLNEIEDEFIGILITIETTDENISLEQYWDNKFRIKKPVDENDVISSLAQRVKDKLKSIRVDGQPALLSESGPPSFENTERTAWVKKGSKVFELTAFGCGETGTYPSKIAEETFDKMLTTFKFL